MERIIGKLLPWYEEHKRSLPWRQDRNPYHIWVSEIMLQQTRVEAVKPYYHRFMETLPTVQALAECPEEKLMKLWEGLGYYSRVRNMQKAAQQIMQEHGGIVPETKAQLEKLAGIGSYTAGAIASIAFEEAVPAADGNVFRIVSRLQMDSRDIMKQSVRKDMEAQLLSAMQSYMWDSSSPGDFNQSLMDLGAGVCLPNAAPNCGICPLVDLCRAHAEGRETEFPVRTPKKPRRIEDRTILLIRDGERVVLHRRPEKGLLAGLYEFPNLEGTLKKEQALEQVAAMGLAALHIRPLDPAKHVFSHVEWHMIGYEIRVSAFPEDGDVLSGGFLAEIGDVRERYSIPSAYRAYLDRLR
ncbi:MAG: A/G-specific adenine glycosylase [Eubacteriales bacterium]|nr:A/G-specific adenine glycosylase [Eubacteriales bacterium]